jgi:hypothetical protein
VAPDNPLPRDRSARGVLEIRVYADRLDPATLGVETGLLRSHRGSRAFVAPVVVLVRVFRHLSGSAEWLADHAQLAGELLLGGRE